MVQTVTHFLPLDFLFPLLSSTFFLYETNFLTRTSLTSHLLTNYITVSLRCLPQRGVLLSQLPLHAAFAAHADQHTATGKHLLKSDKSVSKKYHLWKCHVPWTGVLFRDKICCHCFLPRCSHDSQEHTAAVLQCVGPCKDNTFNVKCYNGNLITTCSYSQLGVFPGQDKHYKRKAVFCVLQLLVWLKRRKSSCCQTDRKKYIELWHPSPNMTSMYAEMSVCPYRDTRSTEREKQYVAMLHLHYLRPWFTLNGGVFVCNWAYFGEILFLNVAGNTLVKSEQEMGIQMAKQYALFPHRQISLVVKISLRFQEDDRDFVVETNPPPIWWNWQRWPNCFSFAHGQVDAKGLALMWLLVNEVNSTGRAVARLCTTRWTKEGEVEWGREKTLLGLPWIWIHHHNIKAPAQFGLIPIPPPSVLGIALRLK